MASTGPVVDPLTSADGTPVKVVPIKSEGTAKVVDDSVMELLTEINMNLCKILSLLEFEFEMQGDTLDGED